MCHACRYIQQSVLYLKKIDHMASEAIILDYFVSAFWWAAKEQKFTKDQLHAFYTVLHTLLEQVNGTLAAGTGLVIQ